MKTMRKHYKSIDEYIRSFPEHVQMKLMEMREIVRKQAPQAQERISYQMPAFFLNGNLVYFAGYAKHIGFYPGANSIAAFKSKITKYKNAKGSVQFPLDKPLPKALIKQIVKFKASENKKRETK